MPSPSIGTPISLLPDIRKALRAPKNPGSSSAMGLPNLEKIVLKIKRAFCEPKVISISSSSA